MEHVRLDVVGRQNQVLQQPAVVNRGNAISHLLGADRRQGVGDRADATDPLGNLLCVQRVAADKDVLETAEHLAVAGGPGNLENLLAIGFDQLALCVKRKVTFDAGYGLQGNSSRHGRESLLIWGLQRLFSAWRDPH